MVQVVTGDSQEEVLIFRDKQTLHHNIYIIILVFNIASVIYISNANPKNNLYHLRPLHVLINLADRHQKVPVETEMKAKLGEAKK